MKPIPNLITGVTAKFPATDETMVCCERCKKVIPRRVTSQKYCRACSEVRDLERKKLWARKHPPSTEVKQNQAKGQKEKKSIARTVGEQTSVDSAENIGWDASRPIHFVDFVRVAIPFTYAASKNHIYAMRCSGHRFLREESIAFRDEVVFLIRSATSKMKLFHNKVWIDLLVQKPDHRGDAINVLDLVADALKRALDIDDRWFCVRRIDWQIVKTEPLLFIGLGQEDRFDAQVCSYCGQIKPLDEFFKSKGKSKLGVGRECKQCISTAGGIRKQRKREM